MGFLNMLGLMKVEDHNRIVAKQDAVIDKAAGHVAAEEFSGVVGLPNKVALAVQSLKEAKEIQLKNWQRYLTAEDRVTALRRQLDEAKAEAASLRPDAEWARARKAKAAEYEASKRVRKAAKKGAA